MDDKKQKNIKIIVQDEKTLYTPFSPEPEFNDPVKKYIRSKIVGSENNMNLNLTVISQKPIDEEKFRAAISNWIRDEEIVFRSDEKNTLRMLIGLLVFGSIMLIMSLNLQNHFEVLKYSLLPILGSLSLSRATGILVIDIPTIRAKKWILHGMEKNNMITFEYDGLTHENEEQN